MPERGPLRCRPGPAAPRRSRRRGRRPAGTATVRAVRGRRAAISDGGLGPPEPGDGAVSGAAGVCDQGGPDRFGAVRAADGQRGREQVWVTWQSAPRARRVSWSQCRPRCRGRCGPGRCRMGAAHPDTAGRAGRPPAGFPQPLRPVTPSQHWAPFMPASIAYHSRRQQRQFRVAGRQLSPPAGTTSPTKPVVGTGPVFSGARDCSTWEVPFFVAAQ